MAVQLEQLHADRLRLENRNSVLEKVTLSAVRMYLCPRFCLCLIFSCMEVACICALPLALRSNSFVQVLEMKEIEETKPSTSSSGRMLPVIFAACFVQHTVCGFALP